MLAKLHDVDVLHFGLSLMLQLQTAVDRCQVIQRLADVVDVVMPPLFVPGHLLFAGHQRDVEVSADGNPAPCRNQMCKPWPKVWSADSMILPWDSDKCTSVCNTKMEQSTARPSPWYDIDMNYCRQPNSFESD